MSLFELDGLSTSIRVPYCFSSHFDEVTECVTDKTMFKSQIVFQKIIFWDPSEKLEFIFLQKTQITFSTEAPEMISNLIF